MNNLRQYIIEKLRIDKDIKISRSSPKVDQNILWNIIHIIEDFKSYNDFYSNCKFKIGKPSLSGENIIVNICFDKMSGAMWHSLKIAFNKFIESKKQNYLNNKKIKKYIIPAVQKDNLQKIRFYIEDK